MHPGVTHPETLAGGAGGEQLAAGGAVQTGVTDDRGFLGLERAALGRTDHHLAAGHALADVIVGVAFQVQMQTTGVEHTETLPGGAGEARPDRRVVHAQVAVVLGDFAGHGGAHGAVAVGDGVVERAAGLVLHGGAHFLHHLAVERALVERLVALHLAVGRLVRGDMVVAQHGRQIQTLLLVGVAFDALEQIGAADQVRQALHAQRREQLAHFPRHEGEVVDQQFRRADKVLLTQILTLGGHAGGAVVQVTDTQVLTAQHHHRHGAEAERLGAQNGRLDHVQTGLQAAVGLQPDLVAQVVGAQRLVRLGQPQLPGGAGVADRGERAGRSAAVVAGDGDQVGVGLGHAGRHRADTGLGHQLHRHLGRRVDLLEVEDQLRQVLDGVDVVVRRR